MGAEPTPETHGRRPAVPLSLVAASVPPRGGCQLNRARKPPLLPASTRLPIPRASISPKMLIQKLNVRPLRLRREEIGGRGRVLPRLGLLRRPAQAQQGLFALVGRGGAASQGLDGQRLSLDGVRLLPCPSTLACGGTGVAVWLMGSWCCSGLMPCRSPFPPSW